MSNKIHDNRFKKLNPTELKALGYSPKAERYLDINRLASQNKRSADNTISKREYAKIAYNQKSNEQKALEIKSGKREIAPNAPKKARQGRIQKASEQRQLKNKTKRNQPVKSVALADGKIRYDYLLNIVYIIGMINGDLESEYHLQTNLFNIFKQYPKNNKIFYRVVFSGLDENGKASGISSPLHFVNKTSDIDCIAVIQEIIETMLGKYGLNLDSKNLTVTLRIYGI